MSHETKQTLKKFVEKNGMQITVQFFGLVFLILNLWLSNQLAPLVKSIDLLTQRVLAIETVEKQHIDSKEFEMLVHRLDIISNRIDNLIGRIK